MTWKLIWHLGILPISRLYLLNGVNSILQEVVDGGRVLCRRERYEATSSRTDLIWEYDNGETKKEFAIMEFKNTFVLHEHEFTDAMCSSEKAEEYLAEAFNAENKEKMLGEESGSKGKKRAVKKAGIDECTLLTGNALTASKQVAKYHKSTKIEDIALFDWNALVIFDFSGAVETPANPRLVRAIWFEEKSKNHRQYQTFRSMTLGYLLRALRRHGFVNPNIVPLE